MDRMALEKLGLRIGQVEQANNILKKVNKLNKREVQAVCGTCIWSDKCL
jgi:hypothetical protein